MNDKYEIIESRPNTIKKEDLETFDTMKEKLGNKYDTFMYDMNVELFIQMNKDDQTIYDLKQQLQAYKDKEYKLREYIKSNYTQPENIQNFMVESQMDYMLKILNEGSDGNEKI